MSRIHPSAPMLGVYQFAEDPNVLKVVQRPQSPDRAVDITGPRNCPDGIVTPEDAKELGISWKRLRQGLLATDPPADLVAAIQRRNARRSRRTFRLSSGETLTLTKIRAELLETALARLRKKIRNAENGQATIVYPSRVGERYVQPHRSLHNDDTTFVVGPKSVAEQRMTNREARWFFEKLCTETIAIDLWDGRVHYMTPEKKKLLDDRVDMLAADIAPTLKAKGAIYYISIPISAGNSDLNRAMGQWLEQKAKSEIAIGTHEPNAFFINPTNPKYAVIKEFSGDDYLAMWWTLLGRNLVDVYRFTSVKDWRAFFQSDAFEKWYKENPEAAKQINLDRYALDFGDFQTSAGCLFEVKIWQALLKTHAANNLAHKAPKAFIGDDALEPDATGVEPTTYRATERPENFLNGANQEKNRHG